MRSSSDLINEAADQLFDVLSLMDIVFLWRKATAFWLRSEDVLTVIMTRKCVSHRTWLLSERHIVVPDITCKPSEVFSFAGLGNREISGLSGQNFLDFIGNSEEGLRELHIVKRVNDHRRRLCMALLVGAVTVCYFISQHFLTTCIMQVDSGGKVNIVADNCEKNIYMNLCIILQLPR